MNEDDPYRPWGDEEYTTRTVMLEPGNTEIKDYVWGMGTSVANTARTVFDNYTAADVTAASRAYRMGVMDRFTICCCQTEECRCPLHELLMTSLEEGEIRMEGRDQRAREAINIIVTSVENRLAIHREIARGMRRLLHHPAERENRLKHHLLAAYCTIKELRRLDTEMSTSNL